MTTVDKHIIDSYSKMFEGLNSFSKLKLIETLIKSLRKKEETREEKLNSAFGAFDDTESPEKIIENIKKNPGFGDKDIKF
jgi:tRNA (Thr-GGU) A37 N-methylase